MKKLKLDLDALAVESFEPDDEHEAVRGTVDGQQISGAHTCFCPISDGGSCFRTCNATCLCPVTQLCPQTYACPTLARTCFCPVTIDGCPEVTMACPTGICPIDTGPY